MIGPRESLVHLARSRGIKGLRFRLTHRSAHLIVIRASIRIGKSIWELEATTAIGHPQAKYDLQMRMSQLRRAIRVEIMKPIACPKCGGGSRYPQHAGLFVGPTWAGCDRCNGRGAI